MTTPEAIDLAALRALAEKATAGPWRTSRTDIDSYTDDEVGELTVVAYVYREPEPRIGVFGEKFRADSQFIAAMRNALPAILDRLAAAEEVIEAAERYCNAATAEDRDYMSGALGRAVTAYDRCAIAGQQQQEGTT